MTDTKLTLSLLPYTFAICRLAKESDIPPWAFAGDFFSITLTADELSIVCEQENIPEGLHCEKGWRGLKVKGPLDFSLTGLLAPLTTALARAEISIFAVSTFDTDYILVKEEQIQRAAEALAMAGHTVVQ